MSAALDQVWAKVTSQKTALPALYGDIDFSITPERFTDDPAQSVAKRLSKDALDPDKVALIKAAEKHNTTLTQAKEVSTWVESVWAGAATHYRKPLQP